jgi:hypothetical protein
MVWASVTTDLLPALSGDERLIGPTASQREAIRDVADEGGNE